MERSLARKSAALATSSGVPILPIAIEWSLSSNFSGVSALVMSIWMKPGALALTRMLLLASFLAADGVIPMTAAFDAP